MDRLKSQLDNGLLQLEATKTELLQIEKDAPIKVGKLFLAEEGGGNGSAGFLGPRDFD